MRKAIILTSITFLLVFGLQAQTPHTLGDSLNSSFPEISPVLSPDGKTMYYSIYNHPHNHLKYLDGCDIWYSEKDINNHWRKPHRLPDVVNAGQYNTVYAVLDSGNTLLIDGVFTKKGIWYKRGFSYVNKNTDGTWNRPEEIKVKGYADMNQGEMTTAFMNQEKTILIISFSKHISKHNNDLFVSQSIDGKNWSKPKLLDENINSHDEEIAPFLSADGNTLYFASNYYEDKEADRSKYKVYRSQKIDSDDYMKWSKPEAYFDTEGVNIWEAFFRTNQLGDVAYYTHTTDSVHSSDVYEVRLEGSEVKTESVHVDLCTQNCKKFQIEVIDIDSTKLYTDFYSLKINGKYVPEEYINNIEKGITSLLLPKDSVYHIDVETPEHFSFPHTIQENSPSEDLKYLLLKIEVGQKVILDELEFDIARLLENSHWQLDKLGEVLNEHGSVWIEIEGFTDETGDWKLDKVLSKDMAKSVKDYLIHRGIDRTRLHIKSFGAKKPIASNDTEEGHLKNRRIEILFIAI